KPFALPDLWNEQQRTQTGTGANKITGDTDGDHVWDEQERWVFNPAPATNPDGRPGDTYVPYDPETEGSGGQTGYGSTFRDAPGCVGDACRRDMGMPLTIAAQSPS